MDYLDRLRRRVTGTTPEKPEYVCTDCLAGFDERWQVCPECGGYSIRRREWSPIRLE